MSKGQMDFIRCGLLMAVVIPATAFPARAALGGDASTIQADQVHMQGTRRIAGADSYTVHEIQGASGTVVREYFSSQGIVFAVSWHGPWLPDMRQIMGSYFEPYAQAVQSHRDGSLRLGRSPIMIQQPGLMVQSGGHPRSFAGKAYIPDMLPANVRAEDIQ
jgi:Protein of unknown function (DUF2844)